MNFVEIWDDLVIFCFNTNFLTVQLEVLGGSFDYLWI